jgi:hypothetical protein
MTDAGKPTVWDVLEEYADVHDELDDAIDMFSWVIEDMQTALSELEDQASEIVSGKPLGGTTICRPVRATGC